MSQTFKNEQLITLFSKPKGIPHRIIVNFGFLMGHLFPFSFVLSPVLLIMAIVVGIMIPETL